MGAFMGGYGSGRSGSGFTLTDGLLFLDIRYLRKRGYFATGACPGYEARCSVQWSRRGEPSGNIVLLVPGTEAGAYPPSVTLAYRTKAWGETTWTDRTERIPIETTPCHYGGERPWFCCPGCGDRRAVLFSVGGLFRCRGCRRIAYTSTHEPSYDRSIRRALTIQRRLGGHKQGSVFDPQPKPPHMHRRTYQRLCDELDDLNYGSLRAMVARLDKLERSFGALSA
jgi:hypothetical protein